MYTSVNMIIGIQNLVTRFYFVGVTDKWYCKLHQITNNLIMNNFSKVLKPAYLKVLMHGAH